MIEICGSIECDGEVSNIMSGGGSGGTIMADCDILKMSKNGMISAKGGKTRNMGGDGSDGIIAIQCSQFQIINEQNIDLKSIHSLWIRTHFIQILTQNITFNLENNNQFIIKSKLKWINFMKHKVIVPNKWGQLQIIENENKIEIINKLTLNKGGYPIAIANYKLTKGKWYFEVFIDNIRVARIGWGLHSQSLNAENSDCLGDDQKGWGFYSKSGEIRNNNKWFDYSNVGYKNGDYVGCAIDIDNKTMNFYVNGKDFGVAFKNFDVGNGIAPCFSLRGKGWASEKDNKC